MRTITSPGFLALRAGLVEEIDRLRARDPLLPIDVIVPGDVGREEIRRHLARGGGGTLGVRVLAWGAWIVECVRPLLARREGRLLAETGLDPLVARIVEERERRGPLAAAVGTPGLVRALVASLQDLIEGGYTGEVLAEAWTPPPDAVRGALARTLRALESELRSTGLFDRRRLEALAAEAFVRAEDGGQAPLLLFGFHDLTARQRAVVLAAAARRPVTLLVPGPGGPGDAAAEPLLSWARDRGEDPVAAPEDAAPLLTLHEHGFREAALTDPGPERVELVTWPAESDEVRGIARRIRHEVRESGRSFDDFVVIVAADGPSPLLFRRVFAKAGIPLADRAGIPVSRTEDGRFALALARAAAARGAEPELEPLDFLPATPEPVSPDDGVDPVFGDPFTRFRRARDWTETVASFRDLHAHRFGRPVGEEIEAALAALALVHGSRPCRPRDFARALAGALAGARQRADLGGADGDARVLLLGLHQARGVHRPVAFHAGLVEGAVRRALPEDPLLPDRVREALDERFAHQGLRLGTREGARVERTLLARFAFESATERAILSWARRVRTGAEARNPSGLLLDLAAARAGEPVDGESHAFARVAPVPSRAAAREDPVDRTDLEIALLAGETPPGEEELALLLADGRSSRLPDVLRATEGRWRRGVLTRFDGVLRSPRALAAVRNRLATERRAWSPTALESLANCPFSFLVERLLRLEPPEKQEEDFDPRTRGELFHEIAEVLLRRLQEGDLLPIGPDRLPGTLRLLDDLVAVYRADVLRDAPMRRAHRLGTLAVLRDDVAVMLATEAHASPEERSRPLRFEYSFGKDVADAPRLPLGDGRELPLRGKADRVDRRSDGALEIVDLKTGAPRVAAGSISHASRGRTTVHLQLPLYLAAVGTALGERVTRASFYHATAEHGFQRIEFTADDLEAVRPRLVRLLRHALDSAAAGWFPSLPEETCCRRALAPACGPACAARFLRKVSDPDVRARLEILAEPDRPEGGR